MNVRALLLAVRSEAEGEFQAFRVDEAGVSDRGPSSADQLLCLLAIEEFDAIAVSSPPDLEAVKLLRVLSGRLPLLALLNPDPVPVDPFTVYEAAVKLAETASDAA